ncbi:hypothetical protein SAMN04488498_12914 [Mesorhizobium albiziae]|uniref:Uncharacterized protein n=1 Tax=Neomesorhizobium albiziae TaxID=335020 RepID=A0A1I4EP91_9HYPH|nr:hypothetical protein GCM10007937_24500 [Mesorhizobium albiziae]SFL07562.1 hypothetical protein SAMN04488498_12914 [Mesorhizobium albiziae]
MLLELVSSEGREQKFLKRVPLLCIVGVLDIQFAVAHVENDAPLTTGPSSARIVEKIVLETDQCATDSAITGFGDCGNKRNLDGDLEF